MSCTWWQLKLPVGDLLHLWEFCRENCEGSQNLNRVRKWSVIYRKRGACFYCIRYIRYGVLVCLFVSYSSGATWWGVIMFVFATCGSHVKARSGSSRVIMQSAGVQIEKVVNFVQITEASGAGRGRAGQGSYLFLLPGSCFLKRVPENNPPVPHQGKRYTNEII